MSGGERSKQEVGGVRGWRGSYGGRGRGPLGFYWEGDEKALGGSEGGGTWSDLASNRLLLAAGGWGMRVGAGRSMRKLENSRRKMMVGDRVVAVV